MKGIQTEYAGILFRSRLEATWAAFFDLMQWQWQYEPFDCMGWIPDFALTSAFTAPSPVLVEVKPIQGFDTFTAAKIDAADRMHDVVLVGTGPLEIDGQLSLGWLRETYHDALAGVLAGEPFQGWWAAAPFGRWIGDESIQKNPSGIVGFCHAEGQFRDRITGCYDGGGWDTNVAREVRQCWAEAKNRAQWKAGSSRPTTTITVPVQPMKTFRWW